VCTVGEKTRGHHYPQESGFVKEKNSSFLIFILSVADGRQCRRSKAGGMLVGFATKMSSKRTSRVPVTPSWHGL